MNQRMILTIPLRHILLNAILLVALTIIFALNCFLYFQMRNESQFHSIATLIWAENIFVVIGLLSYAILFYLQLYRTIERRIQQDKATREMNERLAYDMQVLGIHTEKMRLIVELSELVQACVNVEEATKAIIVKCRKILHFAEGTLYIVNPTNNTLLEFAIDWGDPVAHKKAFMIEQCWALRKAGIYQVKNPQTDLICDHMAPDTTTAYMCIPLMAQNTIFGMLHLDFPNGNISLNDEDRLLISMITETLSLALANIRLRETLRDQSLHDSLTSLPNRRYLDEFFLKAITFAERNQSKLAVLMIDIDFFKQFNDKYGHEAGDIILQELGSLFQKEIRLSDVMSRYGGEEFLCVLQDCGLDEAKRRAEELRKKVSKLSLVYNTHTLDHITISIGVAIYPDDALTINEIVEKADQALYVAKNSDRNKVVIYSEAKRFAQLNPNL